jgi:transcriptional regulator with XRE-family HTH domain
MIIRSLVVNCSLPTIAPLVISSGPMMGRELQRLRERAGLTQEQLSSQAGLSRPYISQLERSLKSPTVDTLFRLCDALDVSADSVVKRVDAARKTKPSR